MEFRKIKKVLTEEVVETEVNKKESNSDVIDSYTAQEEAKTAAVEYRIAILNAAESENRAIEEYNGILKMEEQTDKEIVDLFHDTIVHIRDEEKAHFQMLTEGLSKFPGFDVEKELENMKNDEKESVKESVDLKEDVASNRTYNVWDIDRVAQKYIDFTDETYDMISDLFYRVDDEVDASEAQSIINQIKETLHVSDNIITQIENELNNTISPAEKRIEEYREDLDNDIRLITQLLESDDIQTNAALERLNSVRVSLEELKNTYHGEKDIGWKREHSITGNKPTKSIIS